MNESRSDQELNALRSISVRELAIVATLMLNFGGIVWGAATLNAAVNDLQMSVQRINTVVSQLASDMIRLNIDHTERIRALETITEHNGVAK